MCLASACTSTSSPEDLKTKKGPSVTFDVASISRADVTTAQSVYLAPFMVYGDMTFGTTTVTFAGDPVTYTGKGNDWECANIQFWMPGHDHSFVAVHPYSTEIYKDVKYDHNALTFSYSLPADHTEGTDILVATHRRKLDPEEFSAQSPIGFYFSHALSLLNFTVAFGDITSTAPVVKSDYIKVKRIELANVATSGTFSIVPAQVQSTKQTNDFVASWSQQSYGEISIPVRNTTVNDKERVDALAISGAVFALPSPETEVDLTITYDLYSNNVYEGEQTATASFTASWRQGQSYTYGLTIPNDNSKPVLMQVTVADWLLGTDSGITVPRK